MKKNLRNAIAKMEEVFGDIPHWFIGSVVLGLVREKGFIKREHEIDYIIHHQDLDGVIKRIESLSKDIVISSNAAEPGVVIEKGGHFWSTDPKVVIRPVDDTKVIRVIKLYIDKIPVDIAVMYEIDDFVYYIVKGDHYAVNKFPKWLFEKMVIKRFEGGRYSFPNTPLDYVERVYGNDWNVVRNDWSCVVNPPCLISKKEQKKIMKLIEEKYAQNIDLWNL